MSTNPTNLMANLTPNQIQLLATFGPVLGAIAGYFAAWWGIDQASALGILMAVIVGGLTIWNGFATRSTSIVTQVANMSEVKEVVLDKTEALSPAIDAATPNNVVVK